MQPLIDLAIIRPALSWPVLSFSSVPITDLTDPNLAEHLLADRTDRIALEVFRTYIYAFPDAPNPWKLLGWIFPPLAPVEAIHLAYPALGHAWLVVSSESALKTGITPEQAKGVSETLEYIRDLLIRGRSQRGRGRPPPEWKQKAVIARCCRTTHR